MMKKLLGLVLSMATLLSLSACGSKVEDNALDTFEKVIQNLTDMKSADYEFKIKTKDDENNIEMKFAGAYDLSTSEPKLSVSLDLKDKQMEQKGYMKIYLNNTDMYLNMMDMVKEKTSIESLLGSTGLPSVKFDKETIKLPKDEIKKYLKEAKVKGDELHLIYDVEKLNGEIKKYTSGSNAALSATIVDDLMINKLEMTIKLNHDMLSTATINIEMSKKVDGETKHADVMLDVSLKNVNTAKVSFPGFTDYTESRSGLLSNIQ